MKTTFSWKKKTAKSTSTKVEITFPFGEFWQPIELYVGFRAMVDDERVDCHITQAALDGHFKGKGDDPIATFKANRGEIEAKAVALIGAGRTTDEGKLAMVPKDF